MHHYLQPSLPYRQTKQQKHLYHFNNTTSMQWLCAHVSTIDQDQQPVLNYRASLQPNPLHFVQSQMCGQLNGAHRGQRV